MRAADASPAVGTERDRLSRYVATVGRGPSRSRSLTMEESSDAFSIVLSAEAEPVQVGAFLSLLRFRGETAEELAGMAAAARRHVGARRAGSGTVDLDWPTYASGRTGGAPWFLLAAKLLSQTGMAVVLHGMKSLWRSAPDTGTTAARLGIPIVSSFDEAEAIVVRSGVVFVETNVAAPKLAELIGLRSLLGLRSPMNSLLRLLDPLGAQASVVGVFHPAYRELHRDAGRLLGRTDLAVWKGGGGEAEINPFKSVVLHRLVDGMPRDVAWPPVLNGAGDRRHGPEPDAGSIWRGDVVDDIATARVVGTAAAALATIRRAIDPGALAACVDDVTRLWRSRRKKD